MGGLRPLRRLVDRLPGDRARARRRAGARAEPGGHGRADARPDVRARCSTRRPPAAGRAASSTGSSARTRRSAAPSPTATGGSRPCFPERVVALDGSAAPAEIAEQVREQVRARLGAARGEAPARGGARRGAGARVSLPRAGRRRQARARAHLRAGAARDDPPLAPGPVRARRARRDDPDRRDPRAPARPPHAAVRGRPARVPAAQRRT